MSPLLRVNILITCELDYAISFWLWILLWEYPHFMEISMFHGNYPHFMEIPTFCGYYLHFMYTSVFCGSIHFMWILFSFRGNIHVPWILSAFHACIRISWILSVFRGNIHVLWILSVFCLFYLLYFTHLVEVTGASLLLLFVINLFFCYLFLLTCLFLWVIIN